ncbi:hypothetical protein ACFFVB_18175 [Formosa undariae]|uniref:Glycogen biosynthesis protein GlgD n=1 Tax=Formosa undariae TaxID=1325436 RepID=A0ABV5F7B7_9FLAO
MGIIKDQKKFNPKQKQSNPTNPTANTDQDTRKFDMNSETIKEQQNKK